MSSFSIMKPRGITTIFGELEEKNVTFLINTAESMFTYLNIVKEELIEVLLARAYKQKDTSFNIMEYSTEVTPWADKLVRCTPQTVTLAADWVRKLTCKKCSNLKDALIATYSDSSCDSVYIITDRLPDQRTADILRQVQLSSDGRSIHGILFTSCEADPAALKFFKQLSIQTDGSFHVISVSRNGRVDGIRPVVTVEDIHAHTIESFESEPLEKTVPTSIIHPPVRTVQAYSNDDVVPNTSIVTMIDNPPELTTTTYMSDVTETETRKYCSVSTSLDQTPVEVVYVREPTTIVHTRDRYVVPNVVWEPCPPHIVHPVVQDLDGNLCTTAGTLVTGMRVLARRDNDGYYYMGVVKQQVTINKRFLIEFDQRPFGARSNNRLQETAIYDIIGHNDGLRHCVVTGDSVLAPCDHVRYAPGTVLEGTEGRSVGNSTDTDHLVVSFFNGNTKNVAKHTAIWLKKAHYDRIKLEIQMPLSAREYLTNSPHYPYQTPPGYYVTPLPAKPVPYQTLITDYTKTPVHTASTEKYHSLNSTIIQESVVKSEDVNKYIPGSTMTKSELDDKVKKQLMEHKMAASYDRGRLLNRETFGRKSVSFRESNELDSGICSAYDEEDFLEDKTNEMKLSDLTSRMTQTIPLRNIGVGTDSSLLYPKKSTSLSENKPDWRYWGKSLDSNELKFNSDDRGQFRETEIEQPLEVRIQPNLNEAGTVNSSALYKSVDSSIKSDRARMEWALKHTNPSQTSAKIAPVPPAATRFGRKDAAREAKEQSFLEYRRKQVINREMSWKEKEYQTAEMKAAKEERYRSYTADVIRRDVARQKDNEQKLKHVQEAKRAVSASITRHQQEKTDQQLERDYLRTEAIRQQKQRREDIRMQRQAEIEDTVARRRAIKDQLTQQKLQEHSMAIKEKKEQEMTRDQIMRNKQMAIRQRFQDIEQANQQKKDLRMAVREQKFHELRSQVLP
ncbi:uncharacterized protein [Antedon mediterranea]|uniref:uncharacterized protein n=1 Tax=Antedon mediterranea TaxID=105859 RepID=UPI003AF885D5